jgi:hypothetical protein
MAKKKKIILKSPEQMFEYNRLKAQKLIPNPIARSPKHKSIPPMRTIPLAMQMELSGDMPDSIVEILSSYKPTVKLRQYGIPSKISLSSDRVNELCLISSYLISENPDMRNNFLELYIDYKQMFFWAMAMVFKPNNPYFAIISSEENSSASLTFAAYLANYYIALSEKHSNDMLFRWYRSLEFVKYKEPEDNSGVVIIQCRWPSWVDNRDKLLRTILNIRAAYENSTLILVMQEEDLSIAPYLLNEEPFGVFLKIGKKEDIGKVVLRKTTSSPINTIMNRIKRQMKKDKN